MHQQHTHRRLAPTIAALAGLAISGAALGQARPGEVQQRGRQQVREPATPNPAAAMRDRLDSLREQQRQLILRQRAGDTSVAPELARLRNQIQRLTQRDPLLSGEDAGSGTDTRQDFGRPDAAFNPMDPPIDGRAVANAEGGLRGELIGEDGFVEIAFPGGGVGLEEFINWVQGVLDINIIAREEVRGQEVLFFAPIRIETSKLLDLLSALLEKDGFALLKSPLGFYQIMPSAELPPVFGEQELTTTQVVQTPLLKPSLILTKINEALGTAANQVRISALDDIGVLLVTGTPARVASVSELIDRYVDERQKITLFTYSFENVSADWARQRILTLSEQLAQAGGAPQAQGGASGGLGNLSTNLILDQGNRLIFRGREGEWETVLSLAERVDTISNLRPERHVVGELAEQIANAGTGMGLGPVRQASSGTGIFRGGVGQRNTLNSSTTQSDDQALASGFVVDSENGVFTYFGTDSQHELVDELVERYLAQSETNRVTIVDYKLQHVPAEDMANLLNEILEDPTQQNQFQGSPFIPNSGQRNQQPVTPEVVVQPGEGDPALAADGEGFVTATSDQVTITFFESRNLILVRATPRVQTEIKRIIERLDKRQPQVLIEAQIVSVSASDNFTFATDVQLSAGQFEFLSSFGVTALATDLTQTNTVAGAAPGLTSAIIRTDFLPFAINALQTIGDAKLISNPRVLVNDNEEASVTSNRSEPFSSTTQGTATTITSQGGTAEAGTTLNVTPQISAGGYLVLEYEIELSNFVGDGVGGLQPPEQSEVYNSIVTIPSDTTIIVGGFVSTDVSKTENRIPLLADIPWLGELFKGVSDTKTSTMIFVFITPKILDDPNFRDLRLATEGPLKDVELEGLVPDMEAAQIPIRIDLAGLNRALRETKPDSNLLLGEDDGVIIHGPGE